MSHIAIHTAQNVAIEYEAAPLKDRIIGCLLDLFILGVASVLISILVMLVTQSQLLLTFILVPIIVFYSLAFEVFNNGRSIGKMALGMQVIRIDGQEARLNDYMTRWSFRCIDIILSFGALASIMISVTKNNQRLGDFVANTVVIKSKPTFTVSLESVLKKKSSEGYEPIYPQAVHFSEEQMLILKSTIDRYQKFRNEAHTEAVQLLASKVAEKMHIAEPKKKTDFLKQVLKDYVILTR